MTIAIRHVLHRDTSSISASARTTFSEGRSHRTSSYGLRFRALQIKSRSTTFTPRSAGRTLSHREHIVVQLGLYFSLQSIRSESTRRRRLVRRSRLHLFLTPFLTIPASRCRLESVGSPENAPTAQL